MSILSKIQTGRCTRAQRVTIYAPEGFGKSTLASLFPGPLFLDVEDSTAQLDVQRITKDALPDLQQFESALDEIAQAKPCKTIVVDTIDWLEEMAVAAVIAADDKKWAAKNIEEVGGGFGKGYNFLTTRMSLTLAKLDRVIDAGINVVLLAHSSVVRFDPPDGAGAFDRYELKLFKDRKGGKGTASLIKEWSDMVLFGNWRTQIKEDGGKFKGVGGRERLMHCNRSASHDAKNRHGMQDVEKWEIASIERAFRSVGAPWGETISTQREAMPAGRGAVHTSVATTDGAAPAASNTNQPADDIPMHFGSDGKGIVSPDEIEFHRLCEPYEKQVNAFLVTGKRIASGQTFRDVTADYRARVLKNPAGFLKAVGGVK